MTAPINLVAGDRLSLRLERRPIYGDSERHATYRESIQTVAVVSADGDGRYTVRKGKRSAVLQFSEHGRENWLGTFGGRPSRWCVLSWKVLTTDREG